MPAVEFLPSRLCAEVPPGTELLEAARRAGIELDASCGGQGTCGACLVRVAAGRVDASASPTAGDLDEGFVQACTARILDTPVTVEVPEQALRGDGPLVGEDAEQILLDELLPGGWDLDPLATKRLLRVPAARLQDGLSDLDRLERALCDERGAQEVVHTLSAMRSTAEALRASDGLATATLIREPGRLQLIGIEAGNRTSSESSPPGRTTTLRYPAAWM
jgi:ferredoxin